MARLLPRPRNRETPRMTLHNATPEASSVGKRTMDSTPPLLEWEDVDGRLDPRQRFALYCLSQCETCAGTGKTPDGPERCPQCRGEASVLALIATAPTPESLGVALVTLGRESEFEGCAIGVLDRMGEVGQKWILRPWLPSPRNATDAGRLLRSRRKD